MKTLTIKQPWAYAIFSRIKDVENRTWKLPPGEYALHVAKQFDKEWFTKAHDPQYIEHLRYWADTNPDAGNIIAIFTLRGMDYKSIWRSQGSIPHKILSVVAVNPQPAKGDKGIWDFNVQRTPICFEQDGH